MRRRLYILAFVLLISSNLSVGKNRNGSNNLKASRNNPHDGHTKTKSNPERNKRSIDENDKPFWANRGKKQSEEDLYDTRGYDNFNRPSNKILKASEKILKEPPFWGNRGRRDSSSVEDFLDRIEYPKTKCQNCNDHFYTPFTHNLFKDAVGRRDDTPFWGNRGRRDSYEVSVDADVHDSSPFWGNRGRRHEEEPFWGNRGRRENEDSLWGNRGRRENGLPFWGTRGRRTTIGQFGSMSPEEDSELFWGNQGRNKASILEALNDIDDEIINHSPIGGTTSDARINFWKNKGRNSALKHLFSSIPRYKNDFIPPIKKISGDEEFRSDSKTVLDDRIYAEEPHYIVVERSSRSSGEIDPYYISRGKKEVLNHFDLAKAVRDRRGAIEEIVKSVKNDPYFIVRGKKDFRGIKPKLNASLHEHETKAKDLICATLNMVLAKSDVSRAKRDGGENDRGRRATLKKLAAQLQIDPYFVSRGKKNGDRMAKEENYEEIINQVTEMCN